MSGPDKARMERRASRGRRESLVLKVSSADVEVDDDKEAKEAAWKPKTKMACTYRMGPVRKFQPHVVKKKGQEILDKAFGDLTYDHDQFREVTDKVSNDIMAFLKEQSFDRYRYVVRVVAGEKKGQTVKIVGRALWDKEKDNYLTVTYENRHLYAVGMVYALYFE